MNLKEEILARTNQGLEVFCFYMPIDFVPQKELQGVPCMTTEEPLATSILTPRRSATV